MTDKKHRKANGAGNMGDLFGGLFKGMTVKAADFSKPQVKGPTWCECKQLPKHRGHYEMFAGTFNSGTPVGSTAEERKRLWDERGLLP